MEHRIARTSVCATPFQIDSYNQIHPDAFTNGIKNTNLPRSRRRGLELGTSRQPGPTWNVGATLTYTQALFLEGAFSGDAFTTTNVAIAGKTVPLVPITT